MNKKCKKIAREAIEHGDEAARLLKLSKEVHEAEMRGLINNKDAIEIVVNLNDQAVAELEKAIELQKEFIDEQNKK